MLNKFIFCLPSNINVIIWKNKRFNNFLNIYIYNKTKNIKLFYNQNINPTKYDKNTNSFFIEKKILNNKNNKLSKFIESFLTSWDVYFFNKIKFKGKGFRIRFFKKTKFMKFFFGRSHKTFVILKNIKMRKINKYKFILKSIKKDKIKKDSYMITKIKPINFYTLRGLRNSRQIIYKRKGKKGTYI